ncbi:hypothetical protein CFBP6625_08120 [Agrobacterium tumefaciens]|nr:hypothetical protein CFBP6625_08120 [Agrobacterium tumefaciens]
MYRPHPEEFDDIAVAAAHGAVAQSDEPMKRPDHKAKKHGKTKTKYEYMRRFPKKPRNGEEVGGGHFVFRRGDSTGRIRPCMWPFEHPSYDSAMTEAARLFNEHGGTYDIVSVCGQVAALPDDHHGAEAGR